MSVKPTYRRFFPAFLFGLLVLMALALPPAAPASANPGGPDSATPQSYRIYLPVTANQIPVTGRLTSAGSPVAGQRVVIDYTTDGWNTYYEYASTTTNADGTFSLPMPPLLTANHRYQVYWVNISSNESWLRSFYGKVGTNQSASHHYEFEIANVRLVSPASGVSISLPVTFIWNRRGIAGDRYGVVLANGSLTRSAAVSPKSDTDRTTVTTLPAWVTPNTRHYWYAYVETPAGFGYSYWMNEIYFRSTTLSALNAASPDGAGPQVVEWNAGLPLPAGSAPALPEARPAE